MDGELDLVKILEVERHLEGCAACAQVCHDHQMVRSAMNAGGLYYKAPASLERRVQSAVRKASREASVPRRTPWRWLSVGAALAGAAAVLLWMLGSGRLSSIPAGEDLLAQEVLSSHVRSLMAAHLADVASTDQHTVKPWFNGKLDYSPPVQDLADQGFPLVAGRLDYLDNRPVAALVYRRHKHVINLFVWPSAGGAGASEATLVTHRGYHLCHWTRAGMTYWAVSDLNEGELKEFARLLQNSAPPTPAPPGPLPR
jgi:anti-sigma factor RsiW